MKPEDMSDGLLRQRRNFMVISSIMIFIKFSGFKIKKLTFSGLSFEELGNPFAIYVLIWILFFYFLFRYHQYFMQEGKSKLLSHFDSKFGPKVQNYSAKITRGIDENASYTPNNIDTIKSKLWKIKVKTTEPQDPYKSQEQEITLNPYVIYKFKLVCWFYLSINTSLITDYLLPYIVALLVLIYCFSGNDFSLISSLEAFGKST